MPEKNTNYIKTWTAGNNLEQIGLKTSTLPYNCQKQISGSSACELIIANCIVATKIVHDPDEVNENVYSTLKLKNSDFETLSHK